MKTKANLFFTIDKKYIQHFSVAVTSLLLNNKDIDFTIYLINDIDDKTELLQLLDFVEKKYGITIQLLNIGNDLFDKYKVSFHLSRAVYFRLLLADIIPASVDKGLFLDSDIVVTGSIKPLMEMEFSDNYIFATDDNDQTDNLMRMNNLGFPVKHYFNAGILLINLKAWRDTGASKTLLEMADTYMDRLHWWDQDLLNMLFYDKWKYFDSKYNAIALKKALPEVPVIIHYTTSSKPWHYLNMHPYKSLYWDYLKLTPYKDSRPEAFTMKNFLKKRYRKLKKIAGIEQ